ncbi:MAG: hypothetical protein ACYDBA_14510, partial [Sulfuricaulis sp.]
MECQIDISDKTFSSISAQPDRPCLSYNLVSMASGMLPLFDLISLLLAAYFSALLYTHWLVPFSFTPRFGSNFGQAA